MNKSEFQSDLVSKPIPYLASKWVLERIPFVFGTDNNAYIEWKESLAGELEVDSRAISITGSASCGFSLSPFKDYQDFSAQSDVDVALVSQHHFDLAWHTLRTLGTKLYSLSPKQQNSVKDHGGRLIYWGTIATDKILPILPYGKSWEKALVKAGSGPPLNGREVKARVYRDFGSLKAYHINSFEKLRDNIIGK
jgi:hypothetical protein